MFGDYGYNRIVDFEPQWVRKGVKCPKPEHVSKKLKEICSFFSEAGQDTVSLVVPKIKESKSNNKPDYSKMYLTLEAIDNCNFTFFGREALVDYIYLYLLSEGQQVTKEQIRQMIVGDWNGFEYSVDNGKTWNEMEPTTITIWGQYELSAFSVPELSAGNVMMIKGVNDGLYVQGIDFEYSNLIGLIDSDGRFNAYGNVMSIAYGDDFVGQTSMQGKGFVALFDTSFITGNASKIISAENLILPATTLSPECYRGMFQGCGLLTKAPKLPATILADNCYSFMFDGCVSLTQAPELPATTLADGCYRGMFEDCTSLTTAPELPATTLAEDCYSAMFWGCTALTKAPNLPATTLAQYCYGNMFNGCTSLTTAPELPARTLVDGCYYDMFWGCSSLNYIKCLATDISASNCTDGWVFGVSSTGTFVKKAGVEWQIDSYYGIPNGWTVEEVD